MCAMNQMINGRQCGILWHVGNVLLTHKDPNVTTALTGKLNNKPGKISKPTVNWGEVHECLGMTTDFSVNGKVQLCVQLP